MSGANGLRDRAARDRVLVFARAPRPGGVKTRLARCAGDATALELYRHFVSEELKMLARGNFSTVVCHHPPDARAEMREWLGDGLALAAQRGDDLGMRMSGAFEEAFAEGLEKVLLVGSDLPDLPFSFVEEAFESLGEHDAVLGPAEDGGYYLIGFRSGVSRAGVFENVRWGGRSVFRETERRLAKNGLAVRILRKWRDIDDSEDLEAWLERRGRLEDPLRIRFEDEPGMH